MELFKKINLQMFATTMTTETGSLSAEMKTYYEKRLIEMADPELVFDRYGTKYPIPKNGGKVIEFRKFAPLKKAMTALTEGVTPAGNSVSVSVITSTLHQYGDFIQSSDLLQMTAIDNIIVQNNAILASQAGRTLNTITRDVIIGGTNVMYAPTKDGTEILSRSTLAADCVLTVDLLIKAVAKLKKMNAPQIEGGGYVAIIHPSVTADLMSSVDKNSWIEANKYATPEAIKNGEIGKIAGCRIIENSEAKIWAKAGVGGLSVYGTMVIGGQAYGVTELEGGGLQHFVKQLGSGGTTDPLDQRATTGWKATKTAERLVEEYMVRIEHVSATDPKAEEN